jgi:hypothetical protein
MPYIYPHLAKAKKVARQLGLSEPFSSQRQEKNYTLYIKTRKYILERMVIATTLTMMMTRDVRGIDCEQEALF